MSKLKYYFMPKRIRSFGIYLLRSLLKKLDESDWTPEVYEVEQYMFRYLRCNDCVRAGVCQHSDCGCKMPERAHVRSDFCPTHRWGPFLSETGWASFKEKEQIKFIIINEEQDVSR